MKKVLIVASVASMIDQFNMQNINILKQQGYEVHVAANFEKGSTISEERLLEFKKELKNLNVLYFQVDFSRRIGNIGQNIKAYKQIKEIIKQNKYKFIHCHSPIGGVCGRIAAKTTGTKVMYTAHGFHFYKGAPMKNWVLYYPIEKVLSYLTDVLITINNEDYELSKNKMKSKSLYYIPGVGVDVSNFSDIKVDKIKKIKDLNVNIHKDSIIILSVGELNKNKNHETIIRSLKIANDSNIHYLIAGKGDLDEYLNKLIRDLNLENQVHMLGFRKDVKELYKIADIFCFPSYREGLSVALIEGMASGLPVICSNIRGNTDLIENNKGGYLCNPKLSDDFAITIKNLAKDKKLRKKMSEFNKLKIKQFDIEQVNRIMEKIYRSN